MSKTEYVPTGISIQTQCLTCVALTELCPDCTDNAEARLSDLAHELVDEGNLQYRKVWSDSNEQPSAHDWVASETRLDRPYFSIYTMTWVDVRKEFLDPITWLADRADTPEDMLELQSNEAVCSDCHYAFNRFAPCPNCN